MTHKTKTDKGYMVAKPNCLDKCIVCRKRIGGEGKKSKYSTCTTCFSMIGHLKNNPSTFETFVKNVIKLLEYSQKKITENENENPSTRD